MRSKKCTGAIAALIGLTGLFLGSPASAHHAGVNFDQTKNFVFKGTVKKFVWANPHVWLYVTVAKKDGSTELWGFEAGGTNMLRRSGIKAEDLLPGDKVTISGAPDRTGKHIAMWHALETEKGRKMQLGLGPGSAPPPGFEPPPGLAMKPPVTTEYN